MPFRCSFCGVFTYFDEVDTCYIAPFGFHQLVVEAGQGHTCLHCATFSQEAVPGKCRYSPYNTHEYT